MFLESKSETGTYACFCAFGRKEMWGGGGRIQKGKKPSMAELSGWSLGTDISPKELCDMSNYCEIVIQGHWEEWTRKVKSKGQKKSIIENDKYV